tara:strand:- start:100 stop:426 length:327 start_codon:yes stop_codon:yes gene_type:complete
VPAASHTPRLPAAGDATRRDATQVNMLAREYCDAAAIKLKPIILSHHMLYGLAKGQQKMSKSNKDSAIFMEDTVDDAATHRRKSGAVRGRVVVGAAPCLAAISSPGCI